ncbi:MAG: chitosanase [Acidobacteria bacterium]|nr:chitosanase [Acidobacteriota bacterium]
MMKQPETNFSEKDIRTAAAIVRIFETGSVKGRYSALAVLNDGAGISFGISQFTHRSGSLAKVVEQYLANGGTVEKDVMLLHLNTLRSPSKASIHGLAANKAFRSALKRTAETKEMRLAQEQIAHEMYMQPAIRACAGSGFTLPLSLAVIYDSLTHGSYAMIRDRVQIKSSGKEFEKTWITEYVRRRDAWLASVPRLRATRYRTRFFLDRIAVGNWHLDLPLQVNGVSLTEKDLELSPAQADDNRTAAGPYIDPSKTKMLHIVPPQLPLFPAKHPQARQPESGSVLPTLDEIEARIDRIAAKYDQIERIANKAVVRTDRAKSLWTTVAGTLWQTGWAVFGIIAGLPREVWLFVAVTAAILTLIYLYRQVSLGKIREGNADEIV